MSLASLLGRASPIYKYYSADRKILDDYKGAYDKYQNEYNAYKSAYDDWQSRADAYNAAVEAWNAGPRTTEYSQSPGYVAYPGEFTMRLRALPARTLMRLQSRRRVERSVAVQRWPRHKL